MGHVEIDHRNGILKIYSNIITYGDAANEIVTERMRREIENMWNAPSANAYINHNHYKVVFVITCSCRPDITELEVLQNTDPRNNYFRIEEFIHGNISFVDGIPSNTGYFLLENLYEGSTTAAHEYGHTIGLEHPRDMDLRGRGVPGIMYPRGTLVEPRFQYDPSKPAGVTGGTMHPIHRVVRAEDIELLKLHKLEFRNNQAILGEFTNLYHFPHQLGG